MNIRTNVQNLLLGVSNTNITKSLTADDTVKGLPSISVDANKTPKIATASSSIINTLISITTLANLILVIVTAISAIIALIMSISKKNKKGTIWSVILLILPIICYFSINFGKIIIMTVDTSGMGNLVSLIFTIISIIIQIIVIIASLIIALKKQK